METVVDNEIRNGVGKMTERAKKYKVFQNDELAGEYTAKEVADTIGCSVNTVRIYANTCRYLYGVYRFECVEMRKKRLLKPKTMTLHLKEEWERTRQKLLHSVYDLSTIPITKLKEQKTYEEKGKKEVSKRINQQNGDKRPKYRGICPKCGKEMWICKSWAMEMGINTGAGTCPRCGILVHIKYNEKSGGMDLERFEDYISEAEKGKI